MESILNYLDKYSPQILFLQVGFLAIILTVLVWVYFYNRRKFHHLKHQIPASVVQSYLDSIIQNSTALKSSLFRGGGLDIDPNSVPSVLPLQQLVGGSGSVGLNMGEDPTEVNALKAQIAQLQAQLNEKVKVISDLERQNTGLQGDIRAKQLRIEELEKLLAAANSGDDSATQAMLAEVTKERDALKETLNQYAVIEDDLANLKRLQQENEQLRAALQAAGASIPTPEPEAALDPVAETIPEPVAVAEVVPDAEPEAEPEPVAEEPLFDELAAMASEVADQPKAVEEALPEPNPVSQEIPMAAAPTSEESEDKSPEDLLSEFEKMLG